MIQLKMNPNDRVIELGCGDNPNPNCQVHVDVRPGPGIDFSADFNLPLPIKDQDFDGIFAQYVLEHISWRNIRLFISEMLRILKPGGKAAIVTANTEAQMQWIKDHPEGWDGKNSFDSCSCVLFGDLDYPENSHKSYLSPALASQLFKEAGFDSVLVHPYGERNTDMVIEAVKMTLAPDLIAASNELIQHDVAIPVVVEEKEPPKLLDMPREEMFDKHYFNGGQKVGGYASDMWGAYRDFPVHEITASKILARKPESVLEIGAGRGYILKRIQDAGIRACGLEISKHCCMTRIADGIVQQDLCKVPWVIPCRVGDITPIHPPIFDLCYSVATLEHIPEIFLPAVIGEMSRICKRGLHGIDFGEKDNAFDQTHCSLHSKDWWYDLFNKHAPDWPVEIINKEDLEKGEVPQEVLKGDGKVKLNIGSFTTMHHHGWTNLDIHDLTQFAQIYKYNFLRCDIRQGLPFPTGGVDLILACHSLEHLTYKEGLSFLRECRRVIKSDGCMRIIVPDANLLTTLACVSAEANGDLNCTVNLNNHGNQSCSFNDFNEINEECEKSPTEMGKLWSLLFAGHQAAYDSGTLCLCLKEAGFTPEIRSFRQGHPQVLKETLDMLPCLSLYIEGTPLLS